MIFRGLGRALRFLREKRGKSQKQVAAAAGVTPPMLSSYENDRTRPELDTLDKILHRGLEATLDELCWALDVVNDRLPRREGGTQAPGKGAADDAHALNAQLRTLLAAGDKPLPPALEHGYAEILHGLLKISRYVFESVARQPDGRG